MNKLLDLLIDNIVVIIFFALLAIVYFIKSKKDSKQIKAKAILKKIESSGQNEPTSLHPEIDPALCGGCGACTKACPEGEILGLINHKAVLLKPSKCVGHGACEVSCPYDAIKLVFGTKTRGMEIPRLSVNYESNVPGAYIAGELGGMGLIRNAVKQGILATKDALAKIRPGGGFDCDVFIVGAGPAGMASSLVCISEKKSYICIDQNSFGGTVYNFPRQKVVMSHPMDLPIVGKKKFKSNKVSKEELLEYWNEVKNSTGIRIFENEKFETMTPITDGFEIKTSKKKYKAKKIILCMGVRGSPRQLGVPGENQSKVTYNLLDPEQYQNKKIVIVGAGNAALEAAQMLGEDRWNNKIELLIRGKSFDRANQDNIQRTELLIKKGRIKTWFESSATEIKSTHVTIKKGSEQHSVENDFVFIFAGAELPQKFLNGIGIQFDKKFGEGLSKTI